MKKILVISNNQEQNFEFQNILESAGYNTYLTDGESDGYKIADRYLPDAIICQLNNYEKELRVIKKLNENSSTECIPLIVIASTSQNVHVRAAMELGADDVLVRPFNKESLLKSVEKRLRKIEVIKSKLADEIISTENAFSNKVKKMIIYS